MEHTLGAAFADDPIWEWLLGPRRITPQRAGRLLGAFAMVHLDKGLTAIAADGAAVAVWAPPKLYRVPPMRFLPYLPLTVATLGPAGIARLRHLAESEKLHPAEPHYYLAILGTHPSAQGRGLGSAVLAPTLARADEEGVGCYLESSKESNIAFYDRHGFEVTGTHDVNEGRGPRIWLMWRAPQAPEDP